ncbi:MAG TPA: hypothetical protein VFF59_09010, partial [Anaerolineae bacterium]|nr:hypothetical protein [Anaerolineae bacterium]
APLAEAWRGTEVEAPPADDRMIAHVKAEILDLLSEIDQLWLERRHDLYFSLRLMAVASFGLLVAAIVDVGWLRLLAGLLALAYLPGLLGLYDFFIGKSKEAKRQRLEQALIAIWSTLEQSAADASLQPPDRPASTLSQSMSAQFSDKDE